jgi:F420-dependent oxidoreductase-like protein
MSLPEKQTSADQLPIHSRVGLVVSGPDSSSVVETIVAAEQAGVYQVWMTQGTPAADTLTIFAAALTRTSQIRVGTAIVPTYPRHPLALAQQVLTLNDLAPGRLRLGVGPSHRPTIEGVYGLPMKTPLEHLREYITILRALLWEGSVDYKGQFYSVKSSLPRRTYTPILISTLREGAYHLAGELTDGALSWVSPVPFLLQKALPALRAGAKEKSRSVPPLIAHIPVALNTDRAAVLASARKQLGRYGQLPFYSSMFAEAGFPVEAGGKMSDALFDNLIVSGDEASVEARLKELLSQGLDELLVMPIGVSDAPAEQRRLAQLLGIL